MAIARRSARAACSAWNLGDETAAVAALVLSELVTNAVRYASGPSIRILVDRPTADRLYFGVVDRAPCDLPRVADPDLESTSGRGLLLIDAYALRWCWVRLGPAGRPWGKQCWAELEACP
ncbi:ATP-binding protein [Streptomyces sp. NPDC093252]|uniref:ATP-binding protein n=1 Tax=Streptomyces sp. NPDC093252 TaxID=3154980 RepID=UPI003421E032